MTNIGTKAAWIAAACLTLSTAAFGHGTAGGEDRYGNEARRIVFPDTAEYRTLVVDLHTHSVFSDGHVWPRIRVAEALRDDLDALAITEHLEYQPHRADIPHPDRNRAFVDATEAASESDLIVIAGSEITRNEPAGHMNAVFISDANTLFKVDTAPTDPNDIRGYYETASTWPAQNAVEAANAQGAFVFWNHPFWTERADGIARMNDFHRANVKAGKLHGIEIANGQDYSAEAHAIALQHGLALIGVSDVHDLIDWDYDVNNGGHRPVNLVLATEKSAAAIKQALFEQRTLVWFRNLLIGRKAEMDAMLAACLRVSAASYRPGSELLDVTIDNASDVRFELRNQTKMTFMDHADRIMIEPNGETKFSVKPGAKAAEIELKFEVENALLTPKKHPSITLLAQPSVE